MKAEIKAGSKLFAEFLGWESMEREGKYIDHYMVPNLFPKYNIDHIENTGWISEDIEDAMFHEDWGWLMAVYEKIIAQENGRWDIEISYKKIVVVDYQCGEQRYEWMRSGEEGMILFLFEALAFYIGKGMFDEKN